MGRKNRKTQNPPTKQSVYVQKGDIIAAMKKLPKDEFGLVRISDIRKWLNGRLPGYNESSFGFALNTMKRHKELEIIDGLAKLI